MSFPGSFNIRYYYGDTLEFRVFPKSSSGEPFVLSTFTSAKFTIARNRTTSEQITCFAEIDSSKTNILCVIRPEDSEQLDVNADGSFPPHVYDIEISKPVNGNPYPTVYTLLTGSVTITRDVTRVALTDPTPEPGQVPNNPTDLVLSSTTDTSLSVSWTAPADGDDPDIYKYAFLPFTATLASLEAAIGASNLSVPATQTSLTIPGLDPSTDYSVIIRSNNSTGDAAIGTILFNSDPFRTDDPDPTVPPAPLIISVNELDESLEIAFTQDGDGGASITNYKYSIDGVNYIEFDPIQTQSPLTISGLTNDVAYPVSIKATNSIGDSAASNTITGTPVAPILPPEPDFVITNQGSGAYLIDGVANDTITLVRGQTYLLEINAPGHPFWIQTVPAPYSAGDVYNDGITNNGTDAGVIEWTVAQSAPSTLYYACENHSSMGGTIIIIDGDNGEYDGYDGEYDGYDES